MYSQVISLGFFCSVALELERLYLRSRSGPFDWVISNLTSVLALIDNGFKDYINEQYLVQDPIYPYIVINQKYGIEFYHDFNPNIPLSSQIAQVNEKYLRRINAFYNDIKNPTLFVRYMKDRAEYEMLCQQYNQIVTRLKQFNISNSLILVGNTEIVGLNEKALPIYKVERDMGDEVARRFLDKNTELMHLLNGRVIAQETRNANKLWQSQKRQK